MLSQFQNSITEIHDVCSYCCKAWGSCVCYTDKEEIVERTSHARVNYCFISVIMEAQGVWKDSLKYSIPGKPGAVCASRYNP